jgi:hypothetical protein
MSDRLCNCIRFLFLMVSVMGGHIDGFIQMGIRVLNMGWVLVFLLVFYDINVIFFLLLRLDNGSKVNIGKV